MDSNWSDADWFHASWIQAGIAPLIAAVVFAYVSMRLFPRFSALTMAIGFAVTASLLGSFSDVPQAPADQIAAVGMAAILLGFLADVGRAGPGLVLWTGWFPALAAIVWLLWPVIERQDIVDSLKQVCLLGGLIWAIAWMTSMLGARERPGHVYTAYFALSLGVSLCCWFTAQPLLAQYAGGLGAAALGALIPVGIAWLPAFRTAAGMAIPSIEHPLRASQCTAVPGAFVIGMVTAADRVYGNLPWASVALFAAIPFVALFSPTNRKQFGISVAVGGILPLILAGAAVYLALHNSPAILQPAE